MDRLENVPVSRQNIPWFHTYKCCVLDFSRELLMRKKNTASIRGKASVILSVLMTLRHALPKTQHLSIAAETGGPPQLNSGDNVAQLRALNFN